MRLPKLVLIANPCKPLHSVTDCPGGLGVQVVAGSNPVAPTIEARSIARDTDGAAGFVLPASTPTSTPHPQRRRSRDSRRSSFDTAFHRSRRAARAPLRLPRELERELAVALDARGVDAPVGDRLPDGAPGLGPVRAVPEPAARRDRGEVLERRVEPARVPEPQLADSRAVHQRTAAG